MTTAAVPAALASLVEPLVAQAGLELYDLERSGGVVRVIVDLTAQQRAAALADLPADGPAVPGVSIDDITSLTRAISRAIDEHDPLPGSFTLEVSSPGLERKLRTPAHFAGAVGEPITAKTVPTYDGPRRIAGTLVAADDDGFTIQPDPDGDGAAGDPVRIAYRDLDKARTTFEWAAQPKPGGKPKPANRKSGPSRAPKQSSKKSSPKKKAS